MRIGRATTSTPTARWLLTPTPARSSGTIQHTPNDPFDYDSVAENVLVDVPGPSGPRKLALEADRNGFAYAIDRTTGKFVWGLPFVKKVTWTKGLDAETGKPIEYDPNKPRADLRRVGDAEPRATWKPTSAPATWAARTGRRRPTIRI